MTAACLPALGCGHWAHRRAALRASLLPRSLEGDGALVLAVLRLRRAGADLVRRPDHDEPAGRARDAAADQQQVVVGVHLDERQVADRHPLVALPPGPLEALLRPAATTVRGQRRGRT